MWNACPSLQHGCSRVLAEARAGCAVVLRPQQPAAPPRRRAPARSLTDSVLQPLAQAWEAAPQFSTALFLAFQALFSNFNLQSSTPQNSKSAETNSTPNSQPSGRCIPFQ